MFKRNEKGFTLVELLIVVVILGILASVAIPRYLTCKDEAAKKACQHNMFTLNNLIEEYNFYYGKWPTFEEISQDISQFPDGPPVCAAGGTYSINETHRTECNIHSNP
jgi:type II secretion system protein G